METLIRIAWMTRSLKVWKLSASSEKCCSPQVTLARCGRHERVHSAGAIAVMSAGAAGLGLQEQVASLWAALGIRCRIVWLQAGTLEAAYRKMWKKGHDSEERPKA